MALDTDALKDEVRALGFATTDVTDDNLDTIIAHCLKTFSDYMPQVRYSDLTSVNGQHDYAPPTGYHIIFDVLWNPSVNPSTWWPLWIELAQKFSGTADFDYPSQMINFRQKLTDFDHQWGGHWKLIGSSDGSEKIRLYPVPDTNGTVVPVIWGAVHTASTFPARNRELLFDGVLAYCEYAKGFAQQKQSGAGWSAGTYKVTGSAGAFLLSGASKKIKSWKFRMSTGGWGGRS